MLNPAGIPIGNAAVAIVAASEVMQRRMLEAFTLLQPRRVEAFASFAALRAALARQEFAWVCASFRDAEGESLVEAFRHLSKDPSLERIAFSVVIDSRDMPELPQLFDCGLMSWHESSDKPETLAQSLMKLLQRVTTETNPCLLAFGYLKAYLKAESRWQEIQRLCAQLLQIFPYDDRLRLNQIEAHIKLGELEKAKDLLQDIEYYDPSLAEQVMELRSLLLKENESSLKSLAYQYQMVSALIVDPLPDTAQLLRGRLQELGFISIEHCPNGVRAAERIARQKFDLYIIEWQTPGLSGPFLLQRIRERVQSDIPIIVLTNVLERGDSQLLKEMGVAQVLRRPLSPQQFMMAAAWAMAQTRAPTETSSFERKILVHLQRGELERARQLLQRFATRPNRDPIKEKYLGACLLYHEERYFEAKTLLVEATHEAPGDNVPIAGMLAKCLIKLGDYQAALRLLQRCTQLSPKHLERLCATAEVALQTKDVRTAEEAVQKAEDLDSESILVRKAKAKVSVVTGQAQRALELMQGMDNALDIIAYLNNLAVSFVKTGDLAEGLRLYRSCMKVITPAQTHLRAILEYNLGLACIKSSDPNLGSVHIQAAVRLGPSPVLARAESLARRLQEAKRHHASVTLKVGDAGSRIDVMEESIYEISLFRDREERRRTLYFLRGLLQTVKGRASQAS